MSYMNTLFMVSFGGTKQTAVKFIIIRYHNCKFYFDRPVEIFGEVIYKMIDISNQDEPIPISIKYELV